MASFETGFHQTISDAERSYAIPHEWMEKHGVKKWGFHGASHRYIAMRAAELMKNPNARIISFHLGGSNSVCAISDGKSRANSLGMSPQSGLPHNNRVGDFDVFALPVLLRETGKSIEEILDLLANHSGLMGLSGGKKDMRDLEAAALAGDQKSKVALDVFIASIRHYLGAYMVLLGGVDAIVFTGGIGENSTLTRSGVCADLGWFGVHLDGEKNKTARGETTLHLENSKVQIWIIPTNEELVVARQTRDLLTGK